MSVITTEMRTVLVYSNVLVVTKKSVAYKTGKVCHAILFLVTTSPYPISAVDPAHAFLNTESHQIVTVLPE